MLELNELSEWCANVLHCRLNDLTIVPLRVSAWSNVFVVTRGNQTFYLKQNPSDFTKEGLLLSEISKLGLDCTPEVIAYDTDNNLLITRGAGFNISNVLESRLDIDILISLIQKYAYLQSKLPLHALTASNARVISTLNLKQRAFNVIEHTYTHEKVIFDEHVSNKILIKCIKQADLLFDSLNALHIDDYLEHGDFHLGNILYDNKCIFIDFAEASIANPMFSLISLKDGLDRRFGIKDDSNLWLILKDMYLNTFGKLNQISLKRLDELYDISNRLYPVYYMISMAPLIENNYIKNGKAFENQRLYRMINSIYEM